MPLWLTFLGAAGATIGLIVTAYVVVMLFFGFRQQKDGPKLSVSGGTEKGSLGVAVSWNPETYAAEFYRILISYASPETVPREGRFTVTFKSPQKKSFFQTVQFPEEFQKLLGQSQKAILQVSVRSVGETELARTFSLSAFKKILARTFKLQPGITKLEAQAADEPSVTTLDFAELTKRQERVDKLISQAKAKEAAQKKAQELAAKKEAEKAAAAKAEPSDNGNQPAQDKPDAKKVEAAAAKTTATGAVRSNNG